jgi:hypothetical protein
MLPVIKTTLFRIECTPFAFGKGTLTFLFESILQDHFIHDLAAENTSPSEKFFAYSIEFFEYHRSAASITLHVRPPFLDLIEGLAIFVPKISFSQKIDKLTILKE